MSISYDYFRCHRCRTPVARIEDYLGCFMEEGIFKTAFNVEVSDTVNNHPILNQSTSVASCVQCKELLGPKFIAVTQPNKYWFVIEGGCLMNTNKLMRNEDLDGDITGQYEDALDQDGDGIDQHADTTEKNGDTNDQCGDTTEQDGDANEQNANQDLSVNGQNADQDLGASGQNVDQDGDANEQVPKGQDVGAKQNDDDDEDGGWPMKRMKI